MIISRIYIERFGHLRDVEFRLKDGMNVIFGKNEAGKSTMLAFVRCMLFGMDNGRKADTRLSYRKRYIPSDCTYAAGILEVDDWVINRKFGKTPKADECTAVHKGVMCDNTEDLGNIITGMSGETFENTWFVRQFDAHAHMTREIEERLSNLSVSGEESVSYPTAMEYLDKQEKQRFNPKSKTADIQEIDEKIANNLMQLQDEIIKEKEQNENINALNDIESQIKLLDKKFEELKGMQGHINRYMRYRQYCILREEKARIEKQLYESEQILEQARRMVNKKSIAVCAVFAAVFMLIGMMFLFAYKDPIYLAFAVSFVPAVFCISQLVSMRKQARAGGAELIGKQIEKLRENNDQKAKELENYSDMVECKKPEQSAEQINSEMQYLQKQKIELAERRSVIKYNVEHYDGNIITKLREQNNNLAEDKRQAEFELDCIRLAKEILSYAHSEFSSDFMPELQKNASDALEKITRGLYTRLLLSKDGDILVMTGASCIPASLLSNGTLDSVYFSLRLGIIKMLCPSYFLLLDDSFIQYDDDRAARAMELMESVAENNQVIYFTCQSRFEKNITAYI